MFLGVTGRGSVERPVWGTREGSRASCEVTLELCGWWLCERRPGNSKGAPRVIGTLQVGSGTQWEEEGAGIWGTQGEKRATPGPRPAVPACCGRGWKGRGHWHDHRAPPQRAGSGHSPPLPPGLVLMCFSPGLSHRAPRGSLATRAPLGCWGYVDSQDPG